MTDTANEINKQVETLLDSYEVKRDIKLIGDDCPLFCEDRGKPGIGAFPRKNHVHGQHYQLTLRREAPGRGPDSTHPANNVIVVDFWNSYHDAELKAFCVTQKSHGKRNAMPTVADVLSCVEFDVDPSFEDWCGEFGYDTDSRKAERIYQECVRQARDFQRMFTAEELAAIGEAVREL